MRKNLTELNDADLLINLNELNLKEARTTAELLLYLGEVERRRIFRRQGYGCMFDYCCKELRYSESAAHRRLSAARAVAQFPELFELLCRKEITISTLSMVSTLLSAETFSEIIPRISGKSQREAERVLAGYRPRSTLRERIRPVSVTLPESEEIAEERTEFTFTLDSEAFSQFEELKGLLSGKFPLGASAEQVFSEALGMALNKISPRRRAARRKARAERKSNQILLPAPEVKSESNKRSRIIPTRVRDEVYVRDEGSCSFVSPDGKRCSSKHRVQYHHKVPYARGGAHTSDNISLICSEHNILLAEDDFGARHMRKFKRGGG